MKVLAGFISGVLVVFLLGAVSTRTQNYHKKIGTGIDEKSVINIACSSDGRTVYISDGARVLRSDDSGSNWRTVITCNKDEVER